MMNTRFHRPLNLALCLLSLAWPRPLLAASASPAFFQQGMDLYKAGRFSDATDAFEQAAKHRDHAQEALSFIERIRKETVERIRNRALTGVNKSTWQSKYYFMNAVGGRVRVGISQQEVFERESANFRPGAIDALNQLASLLARAENARVDLELITEINQDIIPNPQVTTQQLAAVFSYLSLAARNNLPKY
jgi:hypothetical protein